MSAAPRTLHLVTCAAPPCLRLTDLLPALQRDGWDVYVIATPTASTWLATDEVERSSGHPVRHRQRHPHQPKDLPPADAVLVAPATFDTINKWATGVNDSLVLGSGLPIVASVHAKAALTSHPAFPANFRLLEAAGVHSTQHEALQSADPGQSFRWNRAVVLLRSVA